MKTILQILILIAISITTFAQKRLIGKWRISSQKQLVLSADNEFTLTKGSNVFEGAWQYSDMKTNDQLVLHFETGTKKYTIQDVDRNEMRLYDLSKESVMILSRVGDISSSNRVVSSAENDYKPSSGIGFKSAIGIRLGWPTAASYKMFVNDTNAIEAMLGYRTYGFGLKMISLEAAYQIHQDLDFESLDGLQFYYGPGVGIHRLNWSNPYGEGGNSATFFSIKAYAGLSYTMKDIPLNLSVDVMPSYYLGGALQTVSSVGVGLAISARYVIN